MGEKKIKMCQKKDESIKKVLEEIEDKAIESRYTNRIKRTPCVYSNLC